MVKTCADDIENRKSNNNFLSQKDGKIGAFAGARESAATGGKFFTAAYPPTGTLSLLAGNWDHQVGLKVSTKGVMQLVDLGSGPTAAMIPKNAPGSIEWGVFEVGKGGEISVKDGSDIPTRQWITYLDTDGVYYVGLWDGKSSFAFGENELMETSRCDETTKIVRQHYSPCHEDRATMDLNLFNSSRNERTIKNPPTELSFLGRTSAAVKSDLINHIYMYSHKRSVSSSLEISICKLLPNQPLT